MNFERARAALQGRKTYIIGALLVLIGVAEGLLGLDVPGVEVGEDWVAYVLNGLGLTTLRRGIARAA